MDYSNEDPEEIFQKIEVLGEGSYGQVFKALNKKDGNIYAVKVVPVENDISEVEKEIKILKQCSSPYIVSYYGSFKKDNNLWIVIELCAGGSVSDILQILQTPLSEQQIAAVCAAVLKGLEYLHGQKKIHRDIKAGNILLTSQGDVKLADFGVSAQLSNTISKRQTVIGTPYWMAPEVIQETKYDGKADIWSVGITAVEMAELKPPLAGIHPMRAIFMIPNRAPPTLSEPSKWSKEFNDFLVQCLTKNADQRPTAKELLKHPFIRKAKSTKILIELIDKLNEIFDKAGGRANFFKEMREREKAEDVKGSGSDSDSETESDDSDNSDDDESGTMVQHKQPKKKAESDDDDDDDDDEEDDDSENDDSDDDGSGTMVRHPSSTIIKKPTAKSQYTSGTIVHQPSNASLIVAINGNKTITEFVDYFAGLNVEILKEMLENNDQEMEEKIHELKELYAKRKKALESAIQKKLI